MRRTLAGALMAGLTFLTSVTSTGCAAFEVVVDVRVKIPLPNGGSLIGTLILTESPPKAIIETYPPLPGQCFTVQCLGAGGTVLGSVQVDGGVEFEGQLPAGTVKLELSLNLCTDRSSDSISTGAPPSGGPGGAPIAHRSSGTSYDVFNVPFGSLDAMYYFTVEAHSEAAATSIAEQYLDTWHHSPPPLGLSIHYLHVFAVNTGTSSIVVTSVDDEERDRFELVANGVGSELGDPSVQQVEHPATGTWRTTGVIDASLVDWSPGAENAFELGFSTVASELLHEGSFEFLPEGG